MTTPGFNENLNTKDSNQILDKEIQASQVKDRLSCAIALKMARKLNVTPVMVGDKANELKIRIINCQLGCFQVEKATHQNLNGIDIKKMLLEEIEASLVNGNLPCAVALEVAKKLKVAPKEVGDTATKLNIRLINCQLGCF